MIVSVQSTPSQVAFHLLSLSMNLMRTEDWLDMSDPAE